MYVSTCICTYKDIGFIHLYTVHAHVHAYTTLNQMHAHSCMCADMSIASQHKHTAAGSTCFPIAEWV